MCEFKVYLDGVKVAEDVVYAKQEAGRVVVRDVVGAAQTLEGAVIVEVDVFSTRLVLTRNQGGG